jgi:hypothetical protein
MCKLFEKEKQSTPEKEKQTVPIRKDRREYTHQSKF